ncbi:MAG: hypothetical protein ACON4N_03370 [Myxococcota bacterium]
MNQQLAVVFRREETVVSNVTMRPRDGQWLGDQEAALMGFPGRVLQLQRTGDRWSLGDRTLKTGVTETFRHGPFTIDVELVVPTYRFSRRGWSTQLGLAVALGALLLGLGSVDVVRRVDAHRPDLTEAIIGLRTADVAAEQPMQTPVTVPRTELIEVAFEVNPHVRIPAGRAVNVRK